MKLSRILEGSVAQRTTVFMVSMVTVVILVAGIWQIRLLRHSTEEQMQHNADRSMSAAVKVIDNRMATVEASVGTAAAYADMLATDEEQTYSLLQRLIDADEDITAVTLLYKENFFPEHGRYFAPTISRGTAEGLLVKDEIGGPENDFCYLETDSNWIYTNKLDKGYWCLPYVDSMSTNRPLVTYSVPLHDANNKIYAVLCADVDLQWVRQIVEGAKPYDFATTSVMSRDGQYICRQDSVFEGYLLEGKVDRVLWKVGFKIPKDRIMREPNLLLNNMIGILLVLLMAVSAVLYFVIRRQLKPLKQLAESTEELARGTFDVELPVITTHDEVRNLRDSFEQMQHSLANYIEELKITTASKAMMESELKVASDIQRSMLPKIFPPYPDRKDFDVYGELTPAKAVGGDLFDFYIRDEQFFFCIGDVSGKGVPASLVMAVTRALFRTVSAQVSSPDVIVSMLNNAMADGNDSNMFVTLFVGVLDIATGRMTYCNAGHDAPLLVRQTDAPDFLPADPNLPVGVMTDWTFSLQETVIPVDTTIFLYTDGLTEAENIDHAQFGEERIVEVARTASLLPREFVTTMAEHVRAFVNGADQSDDLTLLAIHYKGQNI